MLTIETDNRILNAAAAPNRGGRYAMEGAQVKVKDGRGIIAATDGHIAAVRPVETLNGTSDKGYSAAAFVPRESLGKNPTKNTKALRLHVDGEPNAQGTIEPGSRVDTYKVKGTGKSQRLDPLAPSSTAEGNPPPIRDIVPQAGSWAAVTVTPRLLAAAMEAAKGDEDGGVALYVPIHAGGDHTEQVGKAHRTVTASNGRPILLVGIGDDGGAALAMPRGVKETRDFKQHAAQLDRLDDLFAQC